MQKKNHCVAPPVQAEIQTDKKRDATDTEFDA
jgi:hypothetical protein